MDLSQLKDVGGARHARKRVGRGAGSGMGKTATRGVKGQKSRSGVSIKGFEGGQMPLCRRVPKRGFNNIFGKIYAEVTLDRLQAAIDAKKLDARKPVDATALIGAGVVRSSKLGDGVKLLGSGILSAKLTLDIAAATASAIKAVQAAGGEITVKVIPKTAE
ncbi:MAG: 50S ribosomal protein L15 [Alphaproteobacteria bacterium]|nr:50S ribosomal protein L15 [Alphaproteobacteria bacterium]